MAKKADLCNLEQYYPSVYTLEMMLSNDHVENVNALFNTGLVHILHLQSFFEKDF